MSLDAVYEDLAMAMLAVNNHAIGKVYALRDRLRAEGFFEPGTVAGWTHDEACRRLLAAGYDRGPYYGGILASRQIELARFASGDGFRQVLADLEAGKRDAVTAQLLAVHGVGPAVMRNFWVLQG